MTQDQKWIVYVGELRIKHESEMKVVATEFFEYMRDQAREHEFRDQKSYTVQEHYELFIKNKRNPSTKGL